MKTSFIGNSLSSPSSGPGPAILGVFSPPNSNSKWSITLTLASTGGRLSRVRVSQHNTRALCTRMLDLACFSLKSKDSRLLSVNWYPHSGGYTFVRSLIRWMISSGVVLVARPMSCMPEYFAVINPHTVGSLTIPKS